jgi:hypothetical protein
MSKNTSKKIEKVQTDSFTPPKLPKKPESQKPQKPAKTSSTKE